MGIAGEKPRSINQARRGGKKELPGENKKKNWSDFAFCENYLRGNLPNDKKKSENRGPVSPRRWLAISLFMVIRRGEGKGGIPVIPR